jgi:hemolysin activation/secretion protein
VQVAVLNYSGPTAWKDFSWSTYAIHSRSNVAAVGTLNVVGNGAIVGGRLNESLVAESTRVSALSYGVDFKNFQQNITLPDGTPAKTPVRYMLWSVQYNDFHHAERWDWQWNIGANWGIRGLVNEEQQFGYARYGAHAGFAYIRSAANIVRRLPKNWALAFRVAGQYAEQPLVNNEQFTLGGVDTVRGYLDAASLTDAGVAATFELRLPPATVHQLVIEPYLFFDRGSGLIQQPLLDQIKRGLVRSNLEGWGGGMRMRGPSGIELFLDVSTPLLDGTDLVGPKDHQVPRTPRGDTRLDFNVRYAY